MRDSPAIAPELTATTYFAESLGARFSRMRAMSAPINIESELKNGMTSARPRPVAEGIKWANLLNLLNVKTVG